MSTLSLPTPPQSTPLLELINLTKRYNDRPILQNINLQLYPGETLAVIGPSGTGKSSLLRIIAG